jgi:hypothetical protein
MAKRNLPSDEGRPDREGKTRRGQAQYESVEQASDAEIEAAQRSQQKENPADRVLGEYDGDAEELEAGGDEEAASDPAVRRRSDRANGSSRDSGRSV